MLDPTARAVWRTQFQSMHGPPVDDGTRWSRTLVAETDGIVGVATAATNRVHPGRYTAAVEVAGPWRRRGVGSALVAELQRTVPDPRPLATKVGADDIPARGFAASLGAVVYQRCPGAIVDPTSPEVAAWIAAQEAEPEIAVMSLDHLSATELGAAFTTQYLWVHAPSSPVGDIEALHSAVEEMTGAMDTELSTGSWRAGRLEAAVFVFGPDGDGPVELVAETMTRDAPNGESSLAAAVARSLQAAAFRGITAVEFDGHVDDPHLAPLVESLPTTAASPLLLLEISGGGTAGASRGQDAGC